MSNRRNIPFGSWEDSFKPGIGPPVWIQVTKGTAVILLLAFGAILVYMTGGTKQVFAHFLYVPIILAGYFFGLPGGLIGALLAGLAIGPWMPMVVATGEPQLLSRCFFRFLFFLAAGALSGFLKGYQDKQAESIRQINQLQRRFLIAADAAQIGIWEWNPRTGELFLSKQTERIIGYEAHDFNSANRFLSFIHPEDLEILTADLKRLQDGSLDYLFNESRCTSKDGATKWICIRGRKSGDKRESNNLLMGAMSDITQRKKQEDLMLRSQKLLTMGELSAGIVHEINTPVQYLYSNIEFIGLQLDELDSLLGRPANSEGPYKLVDDGLRETFTSAVQGLQEAMKSCLKGVQRIIKIIESMSYFAHPGAVQHVMVDVNKAIESTITLSNNEWKYCAVVETDLAPDLPMIPGNPSDLNQVWLI